MIIRFYTLRVADGSIINEGTFTSADELTEIVDFYADMLSCVLSIETR